MNRGRMRPVLYVCVIAVLMITGVAAGAGTRSRATDPSAAADQAGQGFTFQGLLEDDGSPVNGSCDTRAQLWDAESGGAQVGTTQMVNDVVVVDGRFTITLNANGEFGETAFTGQGRWLQIAVRCPAGSGSYATLQPRQPLTAAPYAQSLLPGAVISGSLGTGTNAILSLSNLDASGVGLRIPDSGLDSIFIDRAGRNGMFVASTDQDGIFICAAGTPSEGCGSEFSINGIEIKQTQDNGILVRDPGANGLYVGYAGRFGVDVAGKDMAGYFYGAVQITGGCTGCQVANFGINSGTTPLVPGDVVVLTGSRTSRLDGVPILLEVTRSEGEGAVAGVIMGRAEEVTVEHPRENEIGRRLIPREGTAERGDYVTIVTSGLAPVRLDALSGPLTIGQRLTAAPNGAARPLQTVEVNGITLNESAAILGMALEASDTDGDGLVWVLVNPN